MYPFVHIVGSRLPPAAHVWLDFAFTLGRLQITTTRPLQTALKDLPIEVPCVRRYAAAVSGCKCVVRVDMHVPLNWILTVGIETCRKITHPLNSVHWTSKTFTQTLNNAT